MTPQNFNPAHKATLDNLLLGLPDVAASYVFGLPCYKIRGKVFATLYGEGVGIKLPEQRVAALLGQTGYVPFQPFGRSRGNTFVQINREHSEDYLRDQALILESMTYVASLA